MKKLMTLMLGLSFLVGSVAIAADSAKDTSKKTTKTKVKDTAKKDTAKK